MNVSASSCGCIETWPQLRPDQVSHGPGCPIIARAEQAEAREALLRVNIIQIEHRADFYRGGNLTLEAIAEQCRVALAQPSPRAEAMLRLVETARISRDIHNARGSDGPCGCETCSALAALDGAAPKEQP